MSTMLHGCLADTEYLEVTSRLGHRFGVWVTTPPDYEGSAETMPLIYVLDGNWTVGYTAPLVVDTAGSSPAGSTATPSTSHGDTDHDH